MKINTIAVCYTIFALISQSTHALPKYSWIAWETAMSERVNTRDNEYCSISQYGVCNMSRKSLQVTNTRIENNIMADEKTGAICGTPIGICDVQGHQSLTMQYLGQEIKNIHNPHDLNEISNFKESK